MFDTLLQKFFGSSNERSLKRLQKTVLLINQLEASFQELSDTELKAKTVEFRRRYQAGEKVDALLPEAFAAVREAAVRTLGMRHFDVQLIGGMVLHEGNIAEMRTGEGKTLAGTLPAYLNAIPGKGVHIVTVNDYLAERDSEWMRPVYEALGLTVDVIVSEMPLPEKQVAYQADITFGTNNEFGFDYLRDNMAFSLDRKVQRSMHFAIVDEVDSILIDEARTPLIISGAAEDGSAHYLTMNKVIPKLSKQEEEDGPGDYALDEKTKQAFLTEAGHQRMEKLLVEAGFLEEGDSLYAPTNISLMHHIGAALRAHTLYQKDVDYIVKDQQVVIVDEHTGRTMQGRRWSEGLHQAVEAKEGVKIQHENQTLASITFQNYFRMYDKLSGMTGTADTEAYEFQQIYQLDVVVVPTNQTMQRDDQADLIYLNQADKYAAIIEDIKACKARQQPVLVGTASIEASETLAKLLQKEKIVHKVLNAKFHAKEATIIAEAGRPAAVTIATNMAGRGTDIVLGGSLDMELKALGEQADEQQIEAAKAEWQERHQQVLAAGGLRVIGSERHESRRIDNQLRGRSGRQGDPGSSRFYLSLEDNLMRIFASDRVNSIMQKLGMKPGESIEHPWLNRAIENAQRKVEGRNFDIRKQLLDFDNVANDQRQVIYQRRADVMASDDLSESIVDLRKTVTGKLVGEYIPEDSLEEQWDVAGLTHQLEQDFILSLPIAEWVEEDQEMHHEIIVNRIVAELQKRHAEKEATIAAEGMRKLEKSVMLRVLDDHWRDHLASMDHLRQGIHLRGYAQKDPKQEYKREAFELFTKTLDQMRYMVMSVLARIKLQTEADAAAVEAARQAQSAKISSYQHRHVDSLQQTSGNTQGQSEAKVETFIREQPKVGRNEPCPCGSGKKYKQCHGKAA